MPLRRRGCGVRLPAPCFGFPAARHDDGCLSARTAGTSWRKTHRELISARSAARRHVHRAGFQAGGRDQHLEHVIEAFIDAAERVDRPPVALAMSFCAAPIGLAAYSSATCKSIRIRPRAFGQKNKTSATRDD